MTNKTVRTVLLLFLALGFASASGAAEMTAPVGPTDNFPTEIEHVADQLLVATTGSGVNWSCIGAVAGFTVGALVAGAATGGAGLAVAGAYAPLLIPICT